MTRLALTFLGLLASFPVLAADKPLVVFGSYGLATAISLSRVGGLKHFPSDVLIGATIGELIGRVSRSAT